MVAVAFLAAFESSLQAQSGAGAIAEPFKLGTFKATGPSFVGIVLRDSLVVSHSR